MMTTETLLTVDQNTGRQVTWIIEAMRPVPASLERARTTGWTHHALLRRPKGGAIYGAMLEVEPATGQVVRNTRLTVAFR